MALPNEEDNRVLTYLAKIAGRLVDLTPPRSRLEIFFAIWAGMDYPLPSAPYTRFERFLLAAMGYLSMTENLLDMSNLDDIVLGGYYGINNGRVQSSQTNFRITTKIPVEPGKSYVFYGRIPGNRLSSYNRIAWFRANGSYISTANYDVNHIGVGVVPENAAYALLSCNPSGEASATGTPVTMEYINSYQWVFMEGTEEAATYIPFIAMLPSGCYTRLELFMNNIAGGVASLPDGDNSLIERYLREIATRQSALTMLSAPAIPIAPAIEDN